MILVLSEDFNHETQKLKLKQSKIVKGGGSSRVIDSVKRIQQVKLYLSLRYKLSCIYVYI